MLTIVLVSLILFNVRYLSRANLQMTTRSLSMQYYTVKTPTRRWQESHLIGNYGLVFPETTIICTLLVDYEEVEDNDPNKIAESKSPLKNAELLVIKKSYGVIKDVPRDAGNSRRKLDPINRNEVDLARLTPEKKSRAASK